MSDHGRSSPVVRIVRGHATQEEALAVLLALDAAQRAVGRDRGAAPRSGWRRAARLEGVGGPRVLAPTDLARFER